MKKTLIILVTCITTGVFAQNEFPTSNAIWNYKVWASSIYPPWQSERNVYYTICGDTIINEIVYNKLYTNYDTIICGENLGKFLGGIRQNGQKTYFIPIEFGTEILLYDFGVSIGDTILFNYGFCYDFWNHHNNHHYFYEHHNRSIVSNIEIENGIKRIYLEDEGYSIDTWAESIGGLNGLFQKGEQPLNGYSFGFDLSCFKHNDTIKHISNPDCEKCFCQNYIDNKEDTKSNIQIYIDITNYELRITNYELRITNYELRITDLNGKIVFTQKITNKKETIINISHLKSGIYFLQIDDKIIKIVKN